MSPHRELCNRVEVQRRKPVACHAEKTTQRGHHCKDSTVLASATAHLLRPGRRLRGSIAATLLARGPEPLLVPQRDVVVVPAVYKPLANRLSLSQAVQM